jgi:antitoxin PrlF
MIVMSMTSKITSRGRTTPLKEIRDKLGVQPGDTLVYEVEGNAVRVRKAEPFDLAWHRAIPTTLAEWDSANDHENFDDL